MAVIKNCFAITDIDRFRFANYDHRQTTLSRIAVVVTEIVSIDL